jgi:hypothetical protein
MPQQELQAGTLVDRADERQKLLRDILASRSFAKAPRLSSFLAYICAEALKGNGAELNERQIGVDVFGRSSAYFPAEDSIVRANARLLRNRLEVYFATEGKDSDWIILIPKGSYVPVFERRLREAEEPLLSVDTYVRVEEPRVAGRAGRRWLIAGIAAGVLFVVGLLFLALRFHRNGADAAARERPAQIWSQLFTAKRRTLFVPADTTLSLIQTERQVPLTLSEYLGQSHMNLTTLAASGPLPQTLAHISDHQYTSIADLDMAFHIGRLPQAAGAAQLEVRYARDLTLSEARNSNLILMGGPRANPWVQLFADRIDYSLDDHPADGLDYVNVRSPRGGELARYMADVKGGETYASLAVIAFIRGLQGDDHALLLEGTDMAGTEGACDFLLDPNALGSLLAKLTRPDGSIQHFEILLETKTVQGNSSLPVVLAYRTLP